MSKQVEPSVVTLDRPELLNALHPPANLELGRVFDEFEEDPELWVAVVTGAGDRAFCAGNDLKYQAAGGKMEFSPKGFGGLTARYSCVKPLIAAVNGAAVGVGLTMILPFDVIVASEKARFGMLFVKMALVPELASTTEHDADTLVLLPAGDAAAS